MRLSRTILSIVVAGGLLVGIPRTLPGQPLTPAATRADALEDVQGTSSRDPFEGVVSPNLYDNMARVPDARRIERPAPTESRLVEAWSRLRRHSTAYRGPADPFAEPFEKRPPAPAPYREPATSASRRPGQGDAGWFAGAARGADAERLRQIGRMEQQRIRQRGAYGQWPMLPIVPGQVSPLRTIPDPMLQPPGRGMFGYGQGPGSGGPFGFDRNVITGGDPNPAAQTP